MSQQQKTIIIPLLVFGAIAIGIVLFLFAGEQQEKQNLVEKMVRVSGAVVDPVFGTPVAGVDLEVGDTSIRTTEAGRFVFPAVSTEKGIRLTHPELLRAIVKLPDTRDEKQSTDILFSVPLYNLLITVIEQEARGRMDIVYENLAPQVREKLSGEAFRESTTRIFEGSDIADQEIVIRRILKDTDYYNEQLDLRFSDVIEFEVLNENNTKWYQFILLDENLQWHLIL